MKGRSLSKFTGCLLCGAAGDALGYPVEFYRYQNIVDEFGEKGITEYSLADGVAQISDDTQMTLFTANALLYGTTQVKTGRGRASYREYIYRGYLDWLKSQGYYVEEKDCSWLLDVPEIYAMRAPGNTCLDALMSGKAGSVRFRINDSKGCGGIMRVAPVGLYFIGRDVEQKDVDMLGAEAAALTHGHELGYIPAAAFTHIISLAADESVKSALGEIVNESIAATEALFKDAEHIGEFSDIMRRAVELSHGDMPDVDAINSLGRGCVAEETLAIAVYCALKYENDFEKALTASVNHGGDSDSTGAVTGNILGAYLGLKAIPEKFIEQLELKEIIKEIAADLYFDCETPQSSDKRDPVWESKYINVIYKPRNP